MPSHSLPPPNAEHTPDQFRLRDRIDGRSLRRAVQLAVHSRFGFTHCADAGEALWSNREQVWLGRATFLHWSMYEAAIDIPWLVSGAEGAPDTDDELQTAVRVELIALWKQNLASLPCKNTPAWLPLP